MNAWETEFIASLDSKNESRAIEILRSGFPVNYQIRTRDTQRNIQPDYTYPLLLSIELELYEVTYYLLQSGASVDAFDCLGQTSVLVSSLVGNLDLIRLLLSFKANIAARDLGQHHAPPRCTAVQSAGTQVLHRRSEVPCYSAKYQGINFAGYCEKKSGSAEKSTGN